MWLTFPNILVCSLLIFNFVNGRKALVKEISNDIDIGPHHAVSKQKLDRRYEEQVIALEEALPSHVAKIRAGLVKPNKGKGHWKKMSLKPNTAGDQDNVNLQRLDYEPTVARRQGNHLEETTSSSKKKFYKRLFKKPIKMGKKLKNRHLEKDEKYRKYKKHMKKKYNHSQQQHQVHQVQTP